MQPAPGKKRHHQKADRKYILFPFLLWRDQISRGTVRSDLIAGLTGAIVVLPQGVAFAAVAGMPPQYGLYSAMVPAIVAALFGSSWLLVSGPHTAASLLLFSSLSLHAQPGSHEYAQLAITLTILVGFIQLNLGLVRFDSLVNFISPSVIMGFTSGAAVLIIASQLKHFLGLSYPRASSFHNTVEAAVIHITEVNPYAAAIGTITILAGILIRIYRPSLPYMLISMLAGSTFSLAVTAAVGQETAKIITMGALPAALPPAFHALIYPR